MKRYAVLGLVGALGCKSPSTQHMPSGGDADVTDDATDDAPPDASEPDAPPDAPVPIETHALGMNDVSILLPLSDSPGLFTTVGKLNGVPGFSGELAPRAAFAQLAGTEVYEPFDVFHIVGIRFDLCDRQDTLPCPTGVDGQLRLVLQPLEMPPSAPTRAADTALHAFYPIPAASVAFAVNELRALARLGGMQTESALAVNSAAPPYDTPSEYRDRLRAFVARYAKADKLQLLTLAGEIHSVNPMQWMFRGVQRNGTTFDAFTIPAINATSQRVLLQDTFSTNPALDAPSGFGVAISDVQYNSAGSASRMVALGALAATQNPTMHGPGGLQCASCHVATRVLALRTDADDIDPATVPNRFTSSRAISISYGVSDEVWSPRAFAWVMVWPAISERVANESAVVLDEIEQRFPVP